MAKEIKDIDFKEEVTDFKGVAMVDFWAPWCGACQSAAPIVDALSTKMKDKAKVLKINVDDSQETASKFGVMSIPTFIFFVNGKEAQRKVGLQSQEEFARIIQELQKG